ncbi:DUF2130 domain-containing protein [Faecalicoccus pleomorphus]|uniref:DUF2130 domain-containing protein n=1 Tax=Faecalicoccus pleomorphus TaxID=1323 RepID=A0AAW6CVV1_9FIRM|nr:DUF2130 domain-containing protein [Faecalicoccus pleomorphus]MDB7980208.1 DUF2130 domain-containing protein [Faecalicoccus pleomorphus]MDB7982542.1 DUF2130 domain-containing protein [Faecalicoccus pleomorphus]
MKEIKCPNCQTIFKIDDDSYYEILKQIKAEELEKERSVLEQKYEKELQLQKEKFDARFKTLQQETQVKEKEWIIREERLKHSLMQEKEKELQSMQEEVSNLKNQIQLSKAQSELENEKIAHRFEKEKEEMEREKQELVNKYALELKSKEEMIEYYKDMKLRLSTKMLGETLEQHCEIQFNQLRATGFQNSYFEKDNDASTGSKGDYIFKEFDDEGNEIISIMFEMKNEADQTATKKTNESFLKELDKDRNQKHCEYAVLVSLLEPESELYNSGIVDMSHRYEKMYVIRPQFFIPMITILRNAALKNVQIRKELAAIKEQNIDITHFEEKMMDFKEGFLKNVDVASRKFQSAVDEIDKTILHLQKVRENLLASDRQLHIANKKVDNLSIRSLTYKNPTMQKMFKEQKGK